MKEVSYYAIPISNGLYIEIRECDRVPKKVVAKLTLPSGRILTDTTYEGGKVLFTMSILQLYNNRIYVNKYHCTRLGDAIVGRLTKMGLLRAHNR